MAYTDEKIEFGGFAVYNEGGVWGVGDTIPAAYDDARSAFATFSCVRVSRRCRLAAAAGALQGWGIIQIGDDPCLVTSEEKLAAEEAET